MFNFFTALRLRFDVHGTSVATLTPTLVLAAILATSTWGCGSSSSGEGVLHIVEEGAHWFEHDVAAVLERVADEDELAFDKIAESLGYAPAERKEEAGEEEAGGIAAQREGPVTIWRSIAHQQGTMQSWIALRERDVGGMTPTREFLLVLQGTEGTEREALVALYEEIAEALTERFRRHRREVLPPGAPEGATLRGAAKPLTRIWELAGDVTISLESPVYRPEIVLELYRTSRREDGVVIRREEYAEPEVEDRPEGKGLLADLEGATAWREQIGREYRESRELPSFQASDLWVPGLDKPASEVEAAIRTLHLAYVQAAALGFEGGALRRGRVQVDGREWLVESADEAGLSLLGAGNAQRKLAWQRIEPATMLAAYRDLRGLSSEELEGYARYAYAVGAAAEGDRMLKRLLDREALAKSALNALLAELRGIAVPRQGFVWERDQDGSWRFLTPEQLEAQQALAHLNTLLTRLRRASRRGERGAQTVEEIVAELRSLDSEAQAQARDVLERHWEEALAWLEEARIDARSWRETLHQRLVEARSEALAAIRDEAAYHREGQRVTGQERVDDLVEEVRALWEAPFEQAVAEDANYLQHTETARWHARMLRELGASSRVSQRTENALEALEQRINAELNLRDNPPTSSARALADYVKSTRKRNDEDEIATDPERSFAHLLNEYRHMLGLEPLSLHGALTRASRVHSEHMDESGRFGHNLAGHPHGDTPADRAAKFDYTGALGENIAMHSNGFTPEGALQAWYGSPDHHRNMLRESWTQIGVGVSANDRYWTTKFGR